MLPPASRVRKTSIQLDANWHTDVGSNCDVLQSIGGRSAVERYRFNDGLCRSSGAWTPVSPWPWMVGVWVASSKWIGQRCWRTITVLENCSCPVRSFSIRKAPSFLWRRHAFSACNGPRQHGSQQCAFVWIFDHSVWLLDIDIDWIRRILEWEGPGEPSQY